MKRGYAWLSFFPLAYLFAFAIIVAFRLQGNELLTVDWLRQFVILHGFATLLTFVIVTAFSIHVIRQSEINWLKTILWLIAFWTLSIVALPYYYFRASPVPFPNTPIPPPHG